jgi:hypothetical protein
LRRALKMMPLHRALGRALTTARFIRCIKGQTDI